MYLNGLDLWMMVFDRSWPLDSKTVLSSYVAIPSGSSKPLIQCVFTEAEAKNKGATEISCGCERRLGPLFDRNNFDRITPIELNQNSRARERLPHSMAKVSRAPKPREKLFLHLTLWTNHPYDLRDGWLSKYIFIEITMAYSDLLAFLSRPPYPRPAMVD